MNKLIQLLAEHEKNKNFTCAIRFLLRYYFRTSWDEKYHQLIGEINLKYLLSFGLIEENFYQKFRYSTLYWSFSSLLAQIAPDKYVLETFHLINAFFGLFIFLGVYHVVKKIFDKRIAKTSSVFLFFSLFFGHLAINNKDIIIAFSHVWIIYYLIKYTSKKFNIKNKFIVLFKISVLAAIGTGIQLLFLGSLIPMLIIFFCLHDNCK